MIRYMVQATPEELKARLIERLQRLVNRLKNGPEVGVLSGFALCYVDISRIFGEEHLQQIITLHMEVKHRLDNNLCVKHGKIRGEDGFCEDCTVKDREDETEFKKIADEINRQPIR